MLLDFCCSKKAGELLVDGTTIGANVTQSCTRLHKLKRPAAVGLDRRTWSGSRWVEKLSCCNLVVPTSILEILI